MNPTTIAKQLRARREALGVTQRDLAVKAKCSPSTINNIEAGCVPRRGTMLDRLNRALDTHAEQVAA